MIMTLFLIFLSITFLFLIVGYIVKSELMIIIGFLMFILLAIPLINQELEYKSGSSLNNTVDNTTQICKNELLLVKINDTSTPTVDDHIYTYNNFTVCNNNIIEVTSYNYTEYKDTIWYGLFFLLIGISGEFSVWYIGYRKKEDD